MTAPSARPPRVSIGVPAYNAEHYLPSALDSLLAQTYTDFELIICDNSSTDRTGEIAQGYAARDKRVRYVRNPENVGAGRNFIRCVQLARGELFRWASADDLSAPTFVERCVEALDANPDAVQAYPRITLIDEHGNELEKYDEKIHTESDSPRERYLHVMRTIGLVNALYGVMRIDLLRRTKIHGAYVGADTVVQSELALYGKILEVPEYLFFRRMHSAAHSAMSAHQQESFYNPSKPVVLSLANLRRLGEQLLSIVRSPISLLDKILLAGSVLRLGIARRDELWEEFTLAARDRWSQWRDRRT